MATLTQKSQVTIPKQFRVALGLRPGDEVEFGLEKTKLVVRKKVKQIPFEKWRGYLGKGSTEELMKEIR